MKAVVLTSNGDILVGSDTPISVAAEDEVVIMISVVALDHRRVDPDPWPLKDSRVPGCLAIGVITQAGTNVRSAGVGDRVLALTSPSVGGLYAEQAAIPAEHVVKLPSHLSDEAALDLADLLLAGSFMKDALSGLQVSTLYLPRPEIGLGLAVVQQATKLGIRVIVSASGRTEADLLTGYGAICVPAGDTAALAESVRALTEGRGADVILDSLAGPRFECTLEALADFGHLFIHGWRDGDPPQLFDTLWSNLDVCPCVRIWDFAPPKEGWSAGEVDQALQLIARRTPLPGYFMEMPLASIHEAHELARDGRFARIALRP